MFRCKQCRHQFGANPPDHCPACGAENRQPDDLSSGRGMGLAGLLTLGCLIEVLAIGLIAGVIAALAIRYL